MNGPGSARRGAACSSLPGGTRESSARAGVCSCSHRWAGGGARATPLQIRRHRRRRRHVRRRVRPSTARRDARLHGVPAV